MYILGEIKKYIREDKNIKVSRETSYLAYKIDKIKQLLTQKLNREPSTKEISRYLEIDEQIVINAINSKCR